MARRLEDLPWERLTADVAPFLEGAGTMPGRDDLLALLDEKQSGASRAFTSK